MQVKLPNILLLRARNGVPHGWKGVAYRRDTCCVCVLIRYDLYYILFALQLGDIPSNVKEVRITDTCTHMNHSPTFVLSSKACRMIL